jgi:hypothetical protein
MTQTGRVSRAICGDRTQDKAAISAHNALAARRPDDLLQELLEQARTHARLLFAHRQVWVRLAFRRLPRLAPLATLARTTRGPSLLGGLARPARTFRSTGTPGSSRNTRTAW